MDGRHRVVGPRSCFFSGSSFRARCADDDRLSAGSSTKNLTPLEREVIAHPDHIGIAGVGFLPVATWED